MSDTRVRKRMRVLRTWRTALQLGILCAAALSCRDVATIWTTQSHSPDGLWVATARTDQYGGPGTAGIQSFVSLRQTRGRQDEVKILQLSQDTTSIGLTLDWLSPTHLEITYNKPANVDFQAIKCAQIEISVRQIQK